MFEKDQIVKHKSGSLLAKVEGPDPTDKRRTIVVTLSTKTRMTLFNDNLEALGKPGKSYG